MQLKLNLNGSVEPLATWFKKFDKIRPSMLLEIDTNLRAFVTKACLEDKSGVRYSSITFDDSFITIVSDNGAEERGGNRIKLAIHMQLPKLIKIIDRISEKVDENGNSQFDIDIEYSKRIDAKAGTYDFVATSVKFTSSVLSMRIDGFRPEELQYLTDEIFTNTVFAVEDPYRCVLSPEMFSAIIKTSDIFKSDSRSDKLEFYNDGQKLYVKDCPEGANEPTMVMYIGDLDAVPEYSIDAVIKRVNFMRMFDKTDESYTIILGVRRYADNSVIDRILFDSLDTATKIVISIVMDA